MLHRRHKQTLSCKEMLSWLSHIIRTFFSIHDFPASNIPYDASLSTCGSLWFTYQSHTYFPPLELGSSEAELTHLCGPDCPGKCAALMNALWRVRKLFPLPSFWKKESHHAVHSVLKLKIFSVQHFKCWDYRQVPPHPVWLLPSHSSQNMFLILQLPGA